MDCIKYVLILFVIHCMSCSEDDAFLNDSFGSVEESLVESGDIIIVSGGNVAPTASPYPIHKIALFNSEGVFKQFLVEANVDAGERLFGAALSLDGQGFYYTVDTVDRVEYFNLTTGVSTLHILSALLSGNTMRATTVLSDGSFLMAESTTSIEKFDSDKNRITTNFPLAATASIQNIKSISNDRFVVLFNGGTDNPRVYSNDGVLITSITGLACNTNCDPYDIVELEDGRFVISYQIAAVNSLELFDENFVHVGTLYQDLDLLRLPSVIAYAGENQLIVCSGQFHNCEKLQIVGDEASLISDSGFIANPNIVRSPTAIMVVP